MSLFSLLASYFCSISLLTEVSKLYEYTGIHKEHNNITNINLYIFNNFTLTQYQYKINYKCKRGKINHTDNRNYEYKYIYYNCIIFFACDIPKPFCTLYKKPKMFFIAYTNIRAKINCRIAIKIVYLKNSNRPDGLFIFKKFSNCINFKTSLFCKHVVDCFCSFFACAHCINCV